MHFYEQVGTPLIPEDMPLEELKPEDMIIPTRAELEARQAKEAEDKGDDTKADGAGEPGKSGSDGDGSGSDGTSDKPDKSDDGKGGQAEDQETVLAGASNNQPQALDDPGEFVPGDHSFEVVIYDEEGANGETVKITSEDQFDKLLKEGKNFGNAAALMRANRQVDRMGAKTEADKTTWETAKADYDKQQETLAQQSQQLTQMANELNYLVSKGKLPKVASKYQEADWSDPEVAKQPGVKEQIEVLDYMKKENQARRKAGLGDIGPSAAYAEMKMERADTAAKTADKQAGEARKQASGRVAATTPAPVTTAPKGVSVGRSFGDLSNLSDLM